MARYVSTKSASGGSAGGGTGLTAADVCNTICTLATQAPTAGTTRIMPGFNEWVTICNCPDWNDCYGCTVEWKFDTSLYRAFKWCYRGIRMCACCYMVQVHVCSREVKIKQEKESEKNRDGSNKQKNHHSNTNTTGKHQTITKPAQTNTKNMTKSLNYHRNHHVNSKTPKQQQ